MKGVDIRIARIRAGLKQYQVAAALKMPQTTLCEIETGKRAVPPVLAERILAIIQMLGCEQSTVALEKLSKVEQIC